MKQNAKMAAGCLLACGWLSAAADPCVTSTLANYISLGAQGCTLNGDVFANFSYRAGASGGAATITADQIIVTPFVLVPAAAKLNFSAPWSVVTDQTQESVIRYTIVPPPGGATPSQLQLALGTASIGGIIGAVAVNQPTNVGNFSVFIRCTEVCQGQTNGSLDFDPVSVVLVTHHVHLSGGTGGASLSEFGATLDRCPLCV
ncbi:MAG TPA: hypothetical protein VKB88_10790 [Bryobacteraceae bacterium]|nr:hypothetical protein [Bryobacteraceae bacterium]